MELKWTKKEPVVSRKEYIKLLEEYFDLTHDHYKIDPEKKLLLMEQRIQAFREKYIFHHVKGVIGTTILLSIISAVATGLIIIWAINDIVKYPMEYSFKNIVMISLIFLVSKMKLKFFDTN